MATDKGERVLIEDDEKDLDQEKDEYVVVDQEPEKPSQDQENDDDDDDDDEASLKADDEDESDSDREAIRERRRQEKKERKERREKAIGRDKLELNFLRQRNDELERRMMIIETQTNKQAVNDIDRQIQEAIGEAETAERIIAKAVEAGNGDDVAKAMRYRDHAVAKAQHLNQLKSQQEQNAKPQQQGMAQEVMTYAKEFMATNKWYDPAGGDEDSAIVLAIDARLSKEGYDPRTEEYWDELQDRVQKRLPDKFEAKAKPARKPMGGPAVGSGREHAPTSTKKEIYISPERKEAMIEAGVWDDPVLRARYVKRYAEYDRSNKS